MSGSDDVVGDMEGWRVEKLGILILMLMLMEVTDAEELG